MAQMTEQEVRRIMREALADPLAFPREFKTWLGSYLEINQPAFHLNQLLGWSGYVGSNDIRTCSSQLALTTLEQSIPGIATTLYNPAKYLIAANIGAKRGLGAVSYGAERVPASADSQDNSAGVAWTNPTYIMVQDATNATCAMTSGQHSDYLLGRTFGFVVPSGTEIQGVSVRIRAGATANYANSGPFTVSLTKTDGVAVGTAKTFTLVANTLNDYGLGSTGDLWGTTLTSSEVNASDFGLIISVNSGVTGTVTVTVDVVTIIITTDSPWGQVTNTLYIGGVAQTPALYIPYSSFADATTENSVNGSWFVNTTATNQAVDLKAKKGSSVGGGTIETTTQLSIARIS